MRPFLFRWSCILLALPCVATAQKSAQGEPQKPSAEIVGGEKTRLLTAARSQYYNLRAAGLKSFGCTAELDWNGFIAQVAGAPLAEDDPTLKYLNSSRLGFVDDLDGKPAVKWAFAGAPPEGKAEAMGHMTSGMVQVVQGFLQAWTPSQNGTLISLSARSFKRAGTGYTIDDAGGSNVDLLTLDKDFLISHASTKNDETVAESDFTFVPSAGGLVLAKIAIDDQIPPSAPATHVTMETTYATVDSFLLPEKVTVSVRNVATFSFRLTNCAVVRQDAKATSAPQP